MAITTTGGNLFAAEVPDARGVSAGGPNLFSLLLFHFYFFFSPGQTTSRALRGNHKLSRFLGQGR